MTTCLLCPLLYYLLLPHQLHVQCCVHCLPVGRRWLGPVVSCLQASPALLCCHLVHLFQSRQERERFSAPSTWFEQSVSTDVTHCTHTWKNTPATAAGGIRIRRSAKTPARQVYDFCGWSSLPSPRLLLVSSEVLVLMILREQNLAETQRIRRTNCSPAKLLSCNLHPRWFD